MRCNTKLIVWLKDGQPLRHLNNYIYTFIPVVNEAPVITEKPKSLKANDGDHVEFVCCAKGKPVPQITWLNGDKPIEEDDDVSIETVTDNEKYQVQSVLSIKKVLLDDESDQYKVEAQNNIGKDEAEFGLIGEFG